MLNLPKKKSERPNCRCVDSIDIGVYNSCPHRCIYCYANDSRINIDNMLRQHDPESPLLIGNITEFDTVYDRKVKKYRDSQMTLRFE